jgi:predicted DNA-binding transcriptional regulator YafY
VPAAFATLQQTPNGVVLRSHVASLEWVAHVLAGMGCPMVVREPDELREELRRLAARMLRVAEAREA